MADKPRSPYDLAVVLPDLGLGGAQRAAIQLISAWHSAGCRVCLVTIGSQNDCFSVDGTVTRVSLDAQAPSRGILAALIRNARRILLLRRAIRRSGAPRVLSFVAGTNVLCLLATRGLGLRGVISERNDPNRQRLGPVWEIMRRVTYSWATVVTANSDAAIRAMAAYVPAGRLALVPNGVAIPSARSILASERERTFLAMGRLTFQKGYDVLLSAFALARKDCVDWRLVFVGDGEDRESLQALAKELKIDDAVLWCGQTDHPWETQAKAGVFVLPSRYEGMPNALLEALAHGVPAIVSEAVSWAQELVGMTGAGFVVRSEDRIALAHAMCALASDLALRDRTSAAAIVAVRPFSFESVMPIWNRVLAL